MTTAIALASDYAALESLLDKSDDLTPEMIADTLEGLGGELADKLDAIYATALNAEGSANICAKEAVRMATRKKSFEKKAAALRGYILTCLLTTGRNGLKTDRNTFTVRKGIARVVIDNADLLPNDFIDARAVIVAKGKEIKAAIDAGLEVPGAHIEIGERTLQVR